MKEMFDLSPYWSDDVNRRLVQSEIEGGVDLREVPPEAVLEVRTQNHSYTIVNKGFGLALISGHPEYCPEPTLANIHGSTWGGSLIRESYIGRGMHLEFHCQDQDNLRITTSPIVEIQELKAA